MFGVGPTEMIVVAVVALMLFSPKELPKMLRSIARFWGQLRATADEFKEQIMHADGVDELTEIVKGTKAQIKGVESDARRELMKARADMRKAQQKLMQTNKAKAEIRKREVAEAEAKAPKDASPDEAEAEAEAEPLAMAEAETPEGEAPQGGPHGSFSPPKADQPQPVDPLAASRAKLIASAKEAKQRRESAEKEARARREEAENTAMGARKPKLVPPPPPTKEGAA
jgi:sec-independent protein translocase protein TatB